MFFSLRRWFKKKGAVGFGRASTQANQVSLCRCSYRLLHALLPLSAYGAFVPLFCAYPPSLPYGAFEPLYACMTRMLMGPSKPLFYPYPPPLP